MLPTEYNSTLDKLWNTFWPSTLVNPSSVVTFIDCLLLCKQLDAVQQEKENISASNNRPVKNPVYTPDQQELRWSSFQHLNQANLYTLFFRRDGALQFVKRRMSYTAIPWSARNTESFKPAPDMLVKAVQLASELQVVNDEHRAEMIDYISGKAKILKKAPKAAAPEVPIKRKVRKARRIKLPKVQVSRAFALVLLSFCLGAVAASLAFVSLRKNNETTANSGTLAYNTEKGKDSINIPAEDDKQVEQDAIAMTKPTERANKKPLAKSPAITTVSLKDKKEPSASLPQQPIAKATPVTKKNETLKEDKTPEPRDTAKTAGLYKIRSKAYFHNEPDERTRRKAFVNHWNNSYATLKALDEKNGFIYVVFHNDMRQTSKGWLLKKDLRPIVEVDTK